ncbi:MAG: carboxypeptidase-like regulatory domain-containing protein, partial [Bacteroidetes bacterium]|nr:carboxypeptidase-like regulatory domain-containing protein [Bacteroidota bacterium]
MTNFDGCEARGAAGAGLRATLWLLLLVCGPVLAAYGQGKIAGRVTDTTGEALIGVNILIEGTQQGAVTDTGGHYVILNVRPGAYTLAFSYIGFQTQRLTDVRVSTGQTTRHDLRLREQVIEGQEIIVRAERPLVQKDLTASKKTFIAEEIDALPVESLFGLLATQAGITTGADGALHIRGGRSNEISYLVDGLSVSNPFNTNGIATRVATDAIEELTVISGAFNAEYGKAMSGIVNLVTKEGGNHLTGSVSFYGGDYVTGNDDLFFTPSSVDLNTYTFEGSLGGPPPFYRNMRSVISARRDAGAEHVAGAQD